VPRISDAYTHCAVYIYESVADARNGVQYGGSGLLAGVELEKDPIKEGYSRGHVYVVTNWHVVLKARNPVLRFNRTDGQIECIETRQDQWHQHKDGDDVAVFPLQAPLDEFEYVVLGTEMFVTPKLIYEEDIGIGDDAVMIGRFITHDGKQRNTPAVRFGNIAMMPGEKIPTEGGFGQEAFLVEIRSLPGYSGSAVLVYSPCAMNDMSQRRAGRKRGEHPEETDPSVVKQGGTTQTTRRMPDWTYLNPKGPFVLGIDFCHLDRKTKVNEPNGDAVSEGWYVKENTGMAGVIPAWKIAEILDYEELRAMRQTPNEEKGAEPPASIDVAL
jgi:hypothetical protein